MAAPAAAPPAAAAPASARLADIGRSGLRAMRQVVPRVVGAGLVGALLGFFLTGLLGLALAGAGAGIRHLAGVSFPTWLVVLDLILTPLAFALAGGYAGGVRGAMRKLAQDLVERRLVTYVYAIVKPSCAAAAARLRSGAGGDVGAELSAALRERLRAADAEDPGEERSLGARIERSLARRSSRMLAMVALRTAVTAKDRGEAVARLEALGIEQLESMMVDTIEDLFSLQVVLAFAAALLVAAAPYIAFFALG
jgi:hypothetical protein